MKYSKLAVLLLLCLLLYGCTKPQEKETEQKDKTISEFSIPGLLEHCIDASEEYCYYTLNEDTYIYKCSMDGTPVAQFAVTADDCQPGGERLSGLCVYGDTLYCYRYITSSLMAVDTVTGECRLLTKLETNGINKMAAGPNSIMILTYGNANKVLLVYHLDTGVIEQVPVEKPQAFAHAEEDTYWINLQDEEGVYCFMEYHADTGTMAEQYDSNFTYELTEMAYDTELGLVYGRMYSLQYLCFNPKEPKNVSRFTAQKIYQSPACFQSVGGRVYIQDVEKGTVYHFEPSAYVTWNEPLKGYVTSEFAVEEWAGYNIELEVIDWEELALKVLAEDKDYDFVIMTTDMAEAVALRDAMAYLPIPEDVIETYWAECWPCVKQGATYNGDIWMLPLEVYARGLVYSEQNLAKYDLSIEDIKTMPDLCEAAKILHANGEIGWYNLQPMQDHLLQEYLWKHQKEETINFDTEEFRAIMEFIREEYKNNDYSNNYYRNSWINLNVWEEILEEERDLISAERDIAKRRRQAAKVYFNETGDYGADQYTSYIGAEGIRVCTVPGMFGIEETVQVKAKFLVLNPNSENKELLMDFVKDMSEIYIANPSTSLSSNAERYVQDVVMQDVCNLYRNGEIVFELPRELFTSYYQYVMGNGELSSDEVVKELNRVVNMYYGE